MIHFQHPDAFLLALVVVLALRRRLLAASRTVTVLRVATLLCLVALLAGPYVHGGQPGRDLILVVDRSRSMPEGSSATVQELVEAAVGARQPGDRVGIVLFGRNAVVEAPPSADYRYVPPARSVDADATDVAAGLERALALVAPGRRATLLLVSDGESTGADAAGVARAALRQGVRIDARVVRREGGLDVAVEEVATPWEVAPGEPFQFAAWLRADVAGSARLRLLRDGEVIAEGERVLRSGANRITLRDRLGRPGIHHYEVEVTRADDRVPENNRARAVVRVAGGERVLCVTPAGRDDRLTTALAAAGIPVVVAAAPSAPLDLDSLDGFGAVILEDIPAADLPAGAMAALDHYVRHLGGGLAMTGGGASFGNGGYHRSRLEEVLPVSMEIRQEQRKFALAMAIALDRSGSMQLQVGGRTKMDLANLGACAAVELLGRADSVAVIAVDSAPHVVVAAGPVDDKAAITARIRTIESMGGGIYVGAALHAAASELVQAPQTNRHILLFADAADAEEPGDYRTFVPDLVRAGVTVSVIGLGQNTDSDAALLDEVARLGGGRCMFVADPADLPRVFAQETIQVARSSMVEEPTAVAVRPDVLALGAIAGGSFPEVGGYSIAYLKQRAQAGLVTDDAQHAPLLAFWQCGVGRAAAFLGEVDGPCTGALGAWPGFADFFATLVRWLAGSDAAERLFAELDRRGHEAVLRVEVEQGHEALLARVAGQVLGPDGATQPVSLTRVGERQLEARIPLRGEGVYRAALQVAGEEAVIRVPPVTLPYSPEFEHRGDPEHGARELARLVEIADGKLDPALGDLFAGPRDSAGVRSLALLAALLALVLWLLEIAGRRLGLTIKRPRLPRLGRLRRRRRAAAPAAAAAGPRSPPEPLSPPAPGGSPRRGIGAVLSRSKARAEGRTRRPGDRDVSG